MKERSEFKDIDKNDVVFTSEYIEMQRAELAYQILTSVPYCWDEKEELTQKYLLEHPDYE